MAVWENSLPPSSTNHSTTTRRSFLSGPLSANQCQGRTVLLSQSYPKVIPKLFVPKWCQCLEVVPNEPQIHQDDQKKTRGKSHLHLPSPQRGSSTLSSSDRFFENGAEASAWNRARKSWRLPTLVGYGPTPHDLSPSLLLSCPLSLSLCI